MTILLIIAAWTLILSLVTGLCTAARLGDRKCREQNAVLSVRFEPTEEQYTAAYTNARPSRAAESEAPLSASGSLAA
jgi:hypothetical protein